MLRMIAVKTELLPQKEYQNLMYVEEMLKSA